MKFTLPLLAALLLAGSVEAHSLPRQKHMSLKEQKAHQVRNLAHARGTVRFFKNHPPASERGKYEAAWHKKAIVWLKRELAETIRAILRRASAPFVILSVFGKDGPAALRVAWCESRLYPGAVNGQYLGLFQMGSYARSRYGHGPDAWTQARAAYRYFVDSGRDWSPWSCKP